MFIERTDDRATRQVERLNAFARQFRIPRGVVYRADGSPTVDDAAAGEIDLGGAAMSRSILPAFMRRREPRGRLAVAPKRRLPPTPGIDRSEVEGISLRALTRTGEECAR